MPGGRSCSSLDHGADEPSRESKLCSRCGAFGDMPHGWVEGDCILQHKAHSRRLIPGAQVCEPCTERWADWLVEIVELYGTLHEVLLAGSVPDDTAEHKRTVKAPASPSPLRLDAWALLHPERLNAAVRGEDGAMHTAYLGHNLPDVAGVLHLWAQAVYDQQSIVATASDTVSGAAAVLRTNLDVLAHDSDVDSFDAELRWLRKALRAAHGLGNPQPLGRCLNVGCSGRVWPNPGAQPKCNRCSRRYGSLDLVRLRITEEAT